MKKKRREKKKPEKRGNNKNKRKGLRYSREKERDYKIPERKPILQNLLKNPKRLKNDLLCDLVLI